LVALQVTVCSVLETNSAILPLIRYTTTLPIVGSRRFDEICTEPN
jgi:hypothetical protein